MPSTSSRLQFAHQLHQSLLRELGHEIEIERLVSDTRYARDVLLVCDACPGTDLVGLAEQFRALAPHVPPASAPATRAEAAIAAASAGASAGAGAAVSRPAPFTTSPGILAPASRAMAESEDDSRGLPAPHNPDDDWTETVAKTPPRKSWLARWRSS